MATNVLPINIAAEGAVIGSILLDRDAISLVYPALQAQHFYSEIHRWVYQAAAAVHVRRTPPDLQTVTDELRVQGHVDAVGGIPGLMRFTELVPTSEHIEHYAKIVKRTAHRRRRIEDATRIAQMGYDESISDEDYEAAAAALLAKNPEDAGERALTHAEIVSSHVDIYQQRAATSPWRSGIQPLDSRVRLLPGRVITIAAPTGQGKTSLAECIAERVARDGGQVLYWSGEVPADQMHDRRLARLAGLPLDRLETGTLSDAQLKTYMDCSGAIANWPGGVNIYDRSVSAGELRMIAMRQQALTGLDLLVVDHLQLLRKTGKESQYEAITDACKLIKQTALDLRIPVIQLSQLSREFYHGADKRPQLWHLKESGEIENSSDTVMLMWLDEAADMLMRAAPGQPGGGESIAVEMHCAIDKHRQGRKGDFALTYIGGRFQFRG